MSNDRDTDRRVEKTKSLLHGALASLIHEKSYDVIAVKEILARANVGRSTFYSHFRDKDELLDSGIRDVLRAGEAIPSTRPSRRADRVLRFSQPIFEHIERYLDAGDSRVDPERQAVVHEHLQRVLIERIADDLRRTSQHRQETRSRMPSDLLARHVASTFLIVLNWWVESAAPLPSRQVNDLFRALVLPTLTEFLD